MNFFALKALFDQLCELPLKELVEPTRCQELLNLPVGMAILCLFDKMMVCQISLSIQEKPMIFTQSKLITADECLDMIESVGNMKGGFSSLFK